ncbi:peptidyl-prolyl cis-trans isomerase [Candidatus Poribacteria bacterium]|nr:peptidyl-prolyl cis-trans isomerase [Candidatus Poribacteria bacterium]
MPEPVIIERVDPVASWPGIFLKVAEQSPPDAAVFAKGLAVTADEYADGLAAYRAENASDTEAKQHYSEAVRSDLALLGYVRDKGLMQDEVFRARARRVLRETLADLVAEWEGVNNVEVTEEEVAARYAAEPDRFRRPTSLTMRLILVPTLNDAEDARRRLDAGEAFADVAAAVSQHPSGPAGGQLPPFQRGTYAEPVEELAFSLKPGEVGQVETARGVYILQKVAEDAESVLPLEEVRGQIREELLVEKRAQARAAFVERIRAQDAPPE